MRLPLLLLLCSLYLNAQTVACPSAPTDATICINAAESSLEMMGGGTLTFPPSTTYCISDNLKILASSITWQMNGSQVSVCAPFSDTPPGGGVASVINLVGGVGGISNIKITNGVLFGLGTIADPKCISAAQTTTVEISFMSASHFGNECIWPAGINNSTGWNIHDNTISSVGSDNGPGAIVMNLDNSISQDNTITTSESGIGINGLNDSILNNVLLDNTDASLQVGGNFDGGASPPNGAIVSGNMITIHATVSSTGIMIADNALGTDVNHNIIHLFVSTSTMGAAIGIKTNKTNPNSTADGCIVENNSVTLDQGGSAPSLTGTGYLGDGASSCVWSNNSLMISNPNTVLQSAGFVFTSEPMGTLTVILRNDTVSGISSLNGPQYAFDINNNSGGSVLYDAAGLMTTGGYIRYGPTLLSGSQYYNTSLAFSNMTFTPNAIIRGPSTLRGAAGLR